MLDDNLIVPTSAKTAGNAVCKIPEGIYVGQLRAIKTAKEDGTKFENKYGPQAILEFDIHRLAENGSVGPQMTFKTENVEHDAVLVQFINIAYKDEKTGNLSSAFTPKSRATETFMALGWKGPDGTPLNMKNYIGKWARVMVEDYEKVLPDGTKDKRSSISKVKPFEGAAPNAPASPDNIDKFLKAVESLKESVKLGVLSEQGFKIAVEQLKKEHGVD